MKSSRKKATFFERLDLRQFSRDQKQSETSTRVARQSCETDDQSTFRTRFDAENRHFRMVEKKVMSQCGKRDINRTVQPRASNRSPRAFGHDLPVHSSLRWRRIHHRLFAYYAAITTLLMMSRLVRKTNFLSNFRLIDFCLPLGITRIHSFQTVSLTTHSCSDNRRLRMCSSPWDPMHFVTTRSHRTFVLRVVQISRLTIRRSIQTRTTASRIRRIRVLRFRPTKNTSHIFKQNANKLLFFMDFIDFQLIFVPSKRTGYLIEWRISERIADRANGLDRRIELVRTQNRCFRVRQNPLRSSCKKHTRQLLHSSTVAPRLAPKYRWDHRFRPPARPRNHFYEPVKFVCLGDLSRRRIAARRLLSYETPSPQKSQVNTQIVPIISFRSIIIRIFRQYDISKLAKAQNIYFTIRISSAISCPGHSTCQGSQQNVRDR